MIAALREAMKSFITCSIVSVSLMSEVVYLVKMSTRSFWPSTSLEIGTRSRAELMKSCWRAERTMSVSVWR